MRVVRSGKSRALVLKGQHRLDQGFSLIVETALKIKQSHFVIDGEAVILGVDGISDFNALHSRQEGFAPGGQVHSITDLQATRSLNLREEPWFYSSVAVFLEGNGWMKLLSRSCGPMA
jgi:hypothetical protein